MANPRRALLRKGNVVNLAEARGRRDAGLPINSDSANDAAADNSTTDTADNPSELASEQQVNEEPAGDRADSSTANVALTDPEPSRSAGSPAAEGDTDSRLVARVAPTDKAANESLETVGKKKAGQKRSTTSAKKHGNRTYNKAKVDAIRAAIANGTYVINPQRIADKFIEQEAKL